MCWYYTTDYCILLLSHRRTVIRLDKTDISKSFFFFFPFRVFPSYLTLVSEHRTHMGGVRECWFCLLVCEEN